MTLWFSATAITPLLVREYHISAEQSAWLTMAVQAGFVGGTLLSALANLADLLNPRTLMFLGSLAGAAANAAVLIAPGATTIIALRFLTGAALALVYPPGMKIAAGWFRDQRGFALGLLIGALTLGKAFPHLLTALSGESWRTPMLFVSTLGILGYTGWFTEEHFADSVGWPIALIAFGIFMIGLSALAMRIDRLYVRQPSDPRAS